MFSFDFVIELASLQKFNPDIDGVLRLIDLMEFHEILMIKFPHYFYFIDERFLSVLFTVGSFLGESFDCIFLCIFMLNDEVYCSEVALANLLYRLEKLVESSEIEFRSEGVPPGEECLLIGRLEYQSLIKSFELQTIWLS